MTEPIEVPFDHQGERILLFFTMVGEDYAFEGVSFIPETVDSHYVYRFSDNRHFDIIPTPQENRQLYHDIGNALKSVVKSADPENDTL